MDYHPYYITMQDGTVKQVNPFTGVEVWSVAERGNRLFGDALREPTSGEPLEAHTPEDYCAFCEANYFDTTPEKSRVVRRGDRFETLHHVPADMYRAERPLLRRVSNLFEIVSISYWRTNYNYKLSPANQRWKDAYISSHEGLQHVLRVLHSKFRRAGRSDEEIAAITMEQKLQMADAFFGGGHEMVIVSPHYREHATTTSDIFSTSDMTDDEHHAYYQSIIDAMNDITENNRYVRYVSIFKNWLRPAGATFDHLHTQLVSIDEWGQRIDRQIRMIISDRNVYNAFGPNFAGHNNLIFAENDHALALVGIGHRYPTIEIYSKSVHARPSEHDAAEVRGMSDLVRACHAAVGGHISVNEEWYYTPFDCIFKMPWHINIKLRVNVPAGFEGGTNIFINPLTPIELRDRLVPRMYQIRHEGRCNRAIRIAEECRVLPNPLQYYKT